MTQETLNQVWERWYDGLTNKENAKHSGCGASQIQRIISRQIKIARNQGRQPKANSIDEQEV